MTRDDAAALDAADELASLRERFVMGDPSLVYLDGNSLGRLPRGSAEPRAHAIASSRRFGRGTHWAHARAIRQ